MSPACNELGHVETFLWHAYCDKCRSLLNYMLWTTWWCALHMRLRCDPVLATGASTRTASAVFIIADTLGNLFQPMLYLFVGRVVMIDVCVIYCWAVCVSTHEYLWSKWEQSPHPMLMSSISGLHAYWLTCPVGPNSSRAAAEASDSHTILRSWAVSCAHKASREILCVHR